MLDVVRKGRIAQILGVMMCVVLCVVVDIIADATHKMGVAFQAERGAFKKT